VPKLEGFPETPNLLIYMWIAEERGVHQITVPRWHCRSNGKLAPGIELVTLLSFDPRIRNVTVDNRSRDSGKGVIRNNSFQCYHSFFSSTRSFVSDDSFVEKTTIFSLRWLAGICAVLCDITLPC
jgi:hypothetical protein